MEIDYEMHCPICIKQLRDPPMSEVDAVMFAVECRKAGISFETYKRVLALSGYEAPNGN